MSKILEATKNVASLTKNIEEISAVLSAEKSKRQALLDENKGLFEYHKASVIKALKDKVRFLNISELERELKIPKNVISKVIHTDGNLTDDQVLILANFFNDFSI
jgi:hypothetical protein